MADVTGSLKDFRPQPLGSTAEVIFTPFGAAVSSSKSLLVSAQIRVSPGSDGSFTVSLATFAATNPGTAYHVRVEWYDAGAEFRTHQDIEWPLVVTGDGQLTDFFAIPTATGFLTKGEKGDDGDSVMQAAFDALVARMPKPGTTDRFRIRDLNGKIAFQITPEGNADIAGAGLKPSDGFRIRDLAGRIAFEVKADGRTYIYDPAFGTGGGGTVTSAVAAKVLRLFLAVGQSNMSGRGVPISAELDPLDARIMQYGATRRRIEPATVPLDMHDAASGLSPATTFAREYLAMQPPNVGVLIVPAAHGSTPFTTAAGTLTWTPNAASAPQYDLPALAVAQTLEAIAAATAAGYIVELTGILWHQGESNGNLSQTSYATLLDSLIAYFRAQLSAPALPFVVGQMCPEGMDVTPSKYNVDAAHQATPARDAYAGFAPATRNGHNIGDTTHFSRVGIEYLGKTYLSGFWQAAGNVLTAPPSAPVNVAATKSGTTVTVSWSAPPASLTAVQGFDLYGAGNSTTWSAPASHIDAYKVETKTGAGAWATVTRARPMNLSETVTVPAGTTQVRVTALNGGTASAPVTTTAIGA